MKIDIYHPSELLKPFIKAFRIIKSRELTVNRILPDTSFAMAFRLKGQISYDNSSPESILPTATFSGLRKSARLIRYAPETTAIIIQFKEATTSAFFNQPLHEFFEESTPLDAIFPHSEVIEIEERLAEADSDTTRISIIEKVLLSRLLYINPDRLVLDAINKIHVGNGLIKINNLAASLFISQDALEKRFRKITGATPKQFSTLVRMNNVIHNHSSSASFHDMALENGYYDQSHFNKDFKMFTGQNPVDFFKSGSYW